MHIAWSHSPGANLPTTADNRLCAVASISGRRGGAGDLPIKTYRGESIFLYRHYRTRFLGSFMPTMRFRRWETCAGVVRAIESRLGGKLQFTDRRLQISDRRDYGCWRFSFAPNFFSPNFAFWTQIFPQEENCPSIVRQPKISIKQLPFPMTPCPDDTGNLHRSDPLAGGKGLDASPPRIPLLLSVFRLDFSPSGVSDPWTVFGRSYISTVCRR